jgi:hypothetical protein
LIESSEARNADAVYFSCDYCMKIYVLIRKVCPKVLL